jgi:hypothetical protein
MEVLAMKLWVLLFLLLGVVSAVPSPAPNDHAARSSPAPLSPDELFSRHALRRARLLIQMRMLELRHERLECVRAALLRQLPAALRPQEPTTWSLLQNSSDARCGELLRV